MRRTQDSVAHTGGQAVHRLAKYGSSISIFRKELNKHSKIEAAAAAEEWSPHHTSIRRSS
jgi:hypothetical protein